MKYRRPLLKHAPKKSLPPRGAWIEIGIMDRLAIYSGCRSPRGERGLKCLRNVFACMNHKVAPPAGSVD